VKDTTAIIEHGDAHPSGAGLFSIDPGLSIWTWVVFGLLFIILRKYAWKPMMDSVEKRDKLISDAVAQAQKTREELEKVGEKQREMLLKATDEAQKIIDSGKMSAEAVAQSIQEKTAEQARVTLEQAREQIAAERERTLREIKEQSVDIIIAASEKLIETVLDDEGHKRIVRKHLEEM